MTVMPSLASRLWLWGPVAVQMAIIFTASSVSDLGELPGGAPDWFGHGVGYAILGGLLLRALSGGRRAGVTPAVALAAIAWSALYGVGDEWHQSFVPGRSPGLGDLMADVAGAALAAGPGWAWARLKDLT
jgi:VanZ family protein